jgi:3D (Asp-Asp-Asp) domain-containing protein
MQKIFRGEAMIIEMVLLGTLTATSYRAVPAQTKPECVNRHNCETSIGENVSELGVAVSQDLLKSGLVHYHDCVYIDGVGFRLVNDCMAARHKKSVDVFVYERNEEKTFGIRHLKVWVLVSNTEIVEKRK